MMQGEENKGKGMGKGSRKGKQERDQKGREISLLCLALQNCFMCISVTDQFLFTNIYIQIHVIQCLHGYLCFYLSP